MKNLKEVILLVFDTLENYNAPHTKKRIGKELFGDVRLIENIDDFRREYEELDNTQEFVLVCHVFHAEKDGERHIGYKDFLASGIEDEFNIKAVLVSSGDSGDVMKNLYDFEHKTRVVYSYSKIHDGIKQGEIIPYQKQNIAADLSKHEEFLYGIITALYKDEFEEVKRHFTWLDSESRIIGSKKYWIGHLNDQPNKKIVAAIPSATGMVDSAIIATQMLEIFKPKYILMSGVCGAKAGTNLGDIVLASKIFTFQKGKISDLRNDDKSLIKLFDADRKEINYDQLFDEKGNKVKVSVEKFEVEHDSIIHFQLKDLVESELERIKEAINKTDVLKIGQKTIDIHFDGMACSTMVINKEGFFEDNIKVIDRKTVAVEMESYGVARACEFGNEGKSKWIIFKSVMDNTSAKDDSAKVLAAHTSGLFLKHLVYDGFLK